ncbi:DegT/DnrJ/EryC1/StrS family aminotransferase [Thalassospira tepidiphila]|uniref:DegT/DnrJ/EryC1/StrS family aminotransferase n=1 Tax=Thalassospira tepidiphila TaxID=393657 RepID=UPI003AA84A0A
MNSTRDIPFGRPWLDDVDRNAVIEVLQGHILTHGPKCAEFETKFQNMMQGGYAVTTSSCMASLHLAAIWYNFGPGDEIIVPAQTHVATVHAVELVGAKPIFVDCVAETGNIDPELIEAAISDKTKGIFLVHFAGIPAQMDSIMGIAKRYDLIVVEDCALAVGSLFDGKHVGLFGNVGCFSFYPVKHITTGEGGMLVSNDKETANNIANFRAFSVDRTHGERKIPGVYDVTGVGMNYRMSEMQAALGCTQVDKIPDILYQRSQNFKYLKNGLSEIEHVNILDSTDSRAQNSHYCLIMVLNKSSRDARGRVIEKMKQRGIGTSVYYPQPVPRMEYYKSKYGYSSKHFPNAELISDCSIALPVGPHLGINEMEYICTNTLSILKEEI